MNDLEINTLDWQKMQGLLPAVVQHAESGKVLMLGYMNQEALIATVTTGQLTLFSRSRQRLWRKGETSGNTMSVQQIDADCDNDSLLIQVIPKGPTCHLGFNTCYQPEYTSPMGFIEELVQIINDRAEKQDPSSYTAQLIQSGVNCCAQKLGEEATEVVIEAVDRNKEALINECADLVFHLLVLLKACEISFYEILLCLKERDRSVHT
ncbi:bifunctional phosphoribosyl-AMP cyclohydrolase/phosphoribosyl-ATP diphosphatase HisIE [Legionella waltersii]|uniref:Histidine biosynthesis bifunctional protein HisIE n=1 Tax=Legionella waltersii TaxID=66969 RepID=A0A0W1AMY7_9GAMM|nr:bifunctional phosphoribosyl-AMP cyclohydrolase/phosphoribosyl-ATP diphosphatase HisIE [Legionella waltersii]KTD82684.1 bifunctional phosphoribosyl-AMP cyclohydrolase/phosphoribosyl-ATP pyrophosphatase protein [Legionella waltersii]SNV03240.1 phosphoribosyl-ATP pyrophosphohydrolase [Legionella waltersii]